MACAATRDRKPCEITNHTGSPLCPRCQIHAGGRVIGELVAFDDRGTPAAGPITGFEVQTDKWSSSAGARVPRATPAVFATVQLRPGFSVAVPLRKLRSSR